MSLGTVFKKALGDLKLRAKPSKLDIEFKIPAVEKLHEHHLGDVVTVAQTANGHFRVSTSRMDSLHPLPSSLRLSVSGSITANKTVIFQGPLCDVIALLDDHRNLKISAKYANWREKALKSLNPEEQTQPLPQPY